MTIEQAINWLDLAKGNAEALKMAKEALEKQIPKKTWNGHCPSCNVELDIWNYCPVCGQALNDNEST